MAGHEISNLNRISDRIDMGVGGAHIGIGPDTAAIPEGEARFYSKVTFGTYTDGENDQITDDLRPNLGSNGDLVILHVESAHPIPEMKMDALSGKVMLDNC